MDRSFEVFNDPDVILAQTQAGISSSPLLQANVQAGAVGSIGGATGTTITIASGGSAGFGITASGVPGTLTLSITVTNAATARTNLGIDAIATCKSNLSAAVAPTVNDDSGDGYSIGSFWIDTVTDTGYMLMDATVGAAVWKQITV